MEQICPGRFETAQRTQLVSERDGCRVILDPKRGRLIHELFEEQARRAPGALAAVYEGDSLTYTALNAKANQLAHYLRERGIGPDQLVGICVERSLEMVVGLLGILKAGGAYMPLDPSYPADRLRYMLGDAGPAVLLTQAHLRRHLPFSGTEVVTLDEQWSEVAKKPRNDLDAVALGLTSHNLAYVIYTSGSTGQPKGVMIEHLQVLNLWQGLESAYRQSAPCQQIALNASLNFDASVQQFVQLLSGRTLFVIPEPYRRDAFLLRRFFSENQIHGVDCTPSQLKIWISSGLLEDERCPLHMVLVGGEAIDSELWDRLARCSGTDFFNVYGPTECTVDVTIACLRGDTTAPHIGQPMENRHVHVLDPDQRPTPNGVTGEIYIGGAGVARGYLNRPELTSERFVKDPFSSDPQGRLYKTGDVGRWRADGNIEYLGRNDHQVKLRGFRIELGEIEAQLARHPNVAEVVVVACEVRPGDKRLVAYVTRKRQITPESEAESPTEQDAGRITELRRYLKSLLPEHMVPSAFVILDMLPLTRNGKLDRAALPSPKFGEHSSRKYEPPRGALEEAIAKIWSQLLRVERVGRMENFFELGGDSLLAMKFIVRSADQLAVVLPVVSISRFPTVAEMAQFIGRLLAESATPLKLSDFGATLPLLPRQPFDAVPLTFRQQWYLETLELTTRRTIRMATRALRIFGRLQAETLRESFAQLVRRHESLRTRILSVEGVQRQQIDKAGACVLEVVDLKRLPDGDREPEARRLVEQLVNQQIDVAKGPLFAARLIVLHDLEHVLVVSLEHIITDAFSMGVLFREIWMFYSQCVRGGSRSLPAMPVQFADYAVWERKTERSWAEKHGRYWKTRLAGAQRVRLFSNEEKTTGMSAVTLSMPVQFGERLTADLSTFSRRERTTLMMTVLTMYAGAILRWGRVSDVVLPVMTMGRVRPELENTVGFFGCPLFLRVESGQNDTFRDLLRRVVSEYDAAFDHHDSGRLEAQRPRPVVAGNPVFNWYPHGLNMNPLDVAGCIHTADLDCLDDRIRLEPFPFEIVPPADFKEIEWDSELQAVLSDTSVGVKGWIAYRGDRVPLTTIQRFERDFRSFGEIIVKEPAARVVTVPIAQ